MQNALKGRQLFAEGLRQLGYVPREVSSPADGIVFDYPVQSGKYSGATYRIGLVVPPDFPNTPPAGPHVGAALHPIASGGSHPNGGIHASPFQDLGGVWQYWSRPFPDWARDVKTTAVYMGHIWKLWDTQ